MKSCSLSQRRHTLTMSRKHLPARSDVVRAEASSEVKLLSRRHSLRDPGAAHLDARRWWRGRAQQVGWAVGSFREIEKRFGEMGRGREGSMSSRAGW